ncbi:hypothetical protein VTI74DRAFT_5325 [Chaetomium olivicolor]
MPRYQHNPPWILAPKSGLAHAEASAILLCPEPRAGTLDALRLLIKGLEAIGVEYPLALSALNPSLGLRIRKFAKLPAMALEPVTGPADIIDGKPWARETEDEIGTITHLSQPDIPQLSLTHDATMIFLN